MTPSRCVALFLAAAVLCPAPGAAQPAVSTTVELGFKTRYLFAGIPFAADHVSHATVSVAAGSLTVNGYAVHDHDAGTVTEADVWGDYYVQIVPSLGAYLGGALYHFKIGGVWEGTPEVYGGVVLAAPLTPTLHVAHDFDLGDGTHVTLTLSHAVPLGTTGASLDLATNIDYNDGYYVETSGLAYADLSAGLSIPVGPLTLRPSVVVQRGIEDGFVDEELFAITASVEF